MSCAYIPVSEFENIASSIRENTNETGHFVNVINITNAFGIEVYESEFDNKNISGIIEVNEDEGKRTILVNSNHSPSKQRYTIAHEVGHFVLNHLASNSKRYRKVDEDKAKKDREEVQADMFASILLMPNQLVVNTWNTYSDLDMTSRIAAVARIFAVSFDAARYRVYNLGLING